MQQDVFIFGQPVEHFGHDRIAVADPDDPFLCEAVGHGEDSPILTFPKQGADRNAQHIVAPPYDNPDLDPETVAKAAPYFRRVGNVDDDNNPLFLDSQRGYLGKAGWFDPPHQAI